MPRIYVTRPVVERIAAKSAWENCGSATPCHRWQGRSLSPSGYARVQVGRHANGHPKLRYIHDVIWESINGPIPTGMQVDHLCCDPAWCSGGMACPHRLCSNIEHLALATARENTLRGSSIPAINARKAHCKRGHPLSGKNLYLLPSGARGCRACRAAAKRSLNEKLKEQRHARGLIRSRNS